MHISECFNVIEGSLRESSQFDISLYYAGKSKCDPLHESVGLRDHYLIHFVLNGKGVLSIDNDTFVVGKSQAFIIYPDEYVKYCADENDPWEYCWIGLGGAYVSSMLSKTGFKNKNHVTQFTNIAKLELLINKIISLNKANSELYFAKLSYMMRIFALLETSTEKTYKNSIKYTHFNNAVDFIHKNYTLDISVNDIAKYVGVERKHLSSIFKDLSNTSPKQYLISTRLNKASVMLTQSDLSIQEIAYSVGYSDPLLFSKSFKNMFGICPRDFKNRGK